MLRYLILWSVVLLNSVPIVHAAAPAKPNLELKVQGLNIDVEWSVPGATGYRLFYVSQATPDKTEVVDMGAVNSISGRMEAGTAMSVMVQAYNEDGDSPLSDAKSFVITDPAATADPGAFQPEAQPLNFKAVFLDTPVAFVPTAEDATKQRRSLRDRSAESGTEFSDGRIGMTVHIAPGLVYRNELELTLCLQIDEVCEPLLIYSNDKKSATDTINIPSEGQVSAGRYAETIVISDLPTDVEKSVYLEILMPPELSDKLRGRAESKYTVYAADVRSQNPTTKHVAVAEIPVVDLGGEDERTRSNTRAADTNWASCTTSAAAKGIVCKTRSFAKDFSNSAFGVGFSITPGLWLFSTTNEQKQTNRGVSIGADANVTAKVFGFSIDNLSAVRGALIKSSGRKVTRKLTLDVLGANVYTKNEYRNKTTGSAAASWNKCGDDDKNCSYEPENANSDAKGGDAQEEGDNDDRMLDFSKELKKEYSKVFIVYVVPVQVSAGVSGKIGVGVGATIKLVTTPSIGLEFDAGGGPYAKLGAFASGGVTIFIAEAGVRVNLTLLDNGLNLDVTALLSSNPSFSGRVYNRLKGPYGNLELYAIYYVPAFSLPPWSKRESTLNIISWSSFEKEFNIYQWSVGGSEQASQPSLPNGSSSGQYVPEFTGTEPPAGSQRWVCFYKGAYFDGDRKCTKMPEGECGSYCKEIGFNLDVIGNGWNDAVRSIKVFGPLRLAVFRHGNFSGDVAYYYASNGEVEQIGGAFYLGASTFILDNAASSVRMTTIDTQVSYRPGSLQTYFYEHANTGGSSFGDSTSSEKKTSYVGNWWNDKISSVQLSGVGVTCIYDHSNFAGFESCYASRGYWSTVNQSYMNDKTSSYALYSGTSYPLILIENSVGIEEAGTSSLPNGNITASGPRAGFCTTSSCELRSNDTADIAYVTGPATIFLYEHGSNVSDRGRTAIFYLDSGEWDAAYLIDFKDVVSSMNVRPYKMPNHSWAELKNAGLLRPNW